MRQILVPGSRERLTVRFTIEEGGEVLEVYFTVLEHLPAADFGKVVRAIVETSEVEWRTTRFIFLDTSGNTDFHIHLLQLDLSRQNAHVLSSEPYAMLDLPHSALEMLKEDTPTLEVIEYQHDKQHDQAQFIVWERDIFIIVSSRDQYLHAVAIIQALQAKGHNPVDFYYQLILKTRDEVKLVTIIYGNGHVSLGQEIAANRLPLQVQLLLQFLAIDQHAT